ncbi:MAG: zinc ABC transporter substrate-binding protein, partial [Bacteroidales bacterium]|nr:zinc ABC transporter substrate-binding protein [Bacteroidales bacterium]
PATYEPTPSQLTSLSKTSLYLKMGYTGFEMAWMEKLASLNSEMNIVNLSDGIDLIMEENAHDNQHHDHGHGGIDPHTWLSPKNAKIISQNTYKALSSAYPELEEIFNENLTKFITEIDSLDAYISASLSELSSRAFFTYHPSLSYFARDYGLEQYPLELGGKTPSAAHMKYLVDKGQEKNIGVVFLQMQFDQKNAEVLADEINAEIVQINPLDQEWYKQMIFIADKLKDNLK